MRASLAILVTATAAAAATEVSCTEAAAAATAQPRGAYVPQCGADGTAYRARQCWGSTGQCWCVYPKTGEKTGQDAADGCDGEEAASRQQEQEDEEEVVDEALFDGGLAELSRDAQIATLEVEANEAQRAAEPALAKLSQLRAEQRRVDNGIIFSSAAAKAMQPAVDAAERDAAEMVREVAVIRAKIKPLYGVVSVQHLDEHRRAIADSFEDAVELGQRNVWIDAIFSRGDRDGSLQGLLMQMMMSFLVGLLWGYVIGFIRFVLTSPFTIYAYCSSVLDLPSALAMWAVGIVLFLLPLLALVASCVLVGRYAPRDVRQGGPGAPRPRRINVARDW